ncbi:MULTISPECIES: FadD7 family fatty acid--CoA ligase [unclassified Mycobacterium]|uniref:FadD7 family fatty acid--CoA ligase n=1 Tax=unclassified Mycobacterium TaxID=2642494 RepID=UPI0007FF74FD|nr:MULTISPECIES: FadD7 family fatty acid--CoA ligase [unclassified Mycobacterium]OBG62679.1 acyl-CoA synthetase [Mycobacterium sp. E3339]OBH83270.1 acyl-CoA synthetase [Mycobacterium sp. E2989]
MGTETITGGDGARQIAGPRIADLVQDAARRYPEAPALIVSADRIPVSYRELLRLVEDLAGQLMRGGLLPGDRVALRFASNAEFVVGLLAASRADLVAVPLDPALPVGEQLARSEAVGARAVLIDGDAPDDEGALPWWPLAVTVGGPTVRVDVNAAPAQDFSTPEGLRDDDAMIMFTGGTTGVPKMVPWTRGNLAASVRAIIAGYGLGPADATVAVMPLYHGHGLLAALLATLASGGAVLLPVRGRFSAHTFWDDIGAVGATWYTAVPTIHQILLERAETDRPGNAALRFIRSCSAPLTAETAQALQGTFSAPVVCAFGMTEATHQVATTEVGHTENPAATPGLVGRSTGPEIRIVGPDGRPVPAGEVGEVWLHGPSVVRGYLGDPAITAANFTDGWLRTGDLGTLSAAGELVIRGRIKELINRGGEKISPERVEGALGSHPDVLEVAVFGVPDKLYGEAVAAVIVPRGSAAPTAEELAAFAGDRLAPFEVPASFQQATELPHTAKGSLDRRAVAQRFGGGA